VLSARDLKLALVGLANELLQRDDEVFSSLAETHKSVCAQWQKAMETREKELRACQKQIAQAAESEVRDAQCAIASRTFDLVLEVTALRAKISRQFDQQMNQEHIIKERVKREYDDLVHSLFSTSFALKNRFEEYRSHLYGVFYSSVVWLAIYIMVAFRYEDVVNGLCEVRTQALQRLKKIAVGKGAEAKLEAGIRYAEVCISDFCCFLGEA
jgi:hypothetical protein